MALYPDDEVDNLEGSTATDDLLQDGDDTFAVPIVRIEGHFDEMTDGMLIDPKFLPPVVAGPVGSIDGVTPIIVTQDGASSWIISIDLADFILRSNPVVPATPTAGDCSLLIASTEYVCNAIEDACQVFGPHPTIAGAYNFEDCDGIPFTIQTYPNPTFVESPASIFTWNDASTGETRVLDLRPNTFSFDGGTNVHTWTNPVTGAIHTISMNAVGIALDPTSIDCVTSTNVQAAFQEICTVIDGLEDRFLTMVRQTDSKAGSVLVTDNTTNETFELMESCDLQRTTNIVPTGSMVLICTPNDGSFKTSIADLIPDPIEPVIPDFPVEFCNGVGIDLDTDQVSGNCGTVYTKYCFSVDLCKFPQIFKSAPNPLGTPPILPLDDATAAYFPICVDGDSVKLSLEDAILCFRNEIFFTEGLGTDMSGTGTSIDPYRIDLDACELPNFPYDPIGDSVNCSDGITVNMPNIKPGTNVTIGVDGTLDVIIPETPKTYFPDVIAGGAVCVTIDTGGTAGPIEYRSRDGLITGGGGSVIQGALNSGPLVITVTNPSSTLSTLAEIEVTAIASSQNNDVIASGPLGFVGDRQVTWVLSDVLAETQPTRDEINGAVASWAINKSYTSVNLPEPTIHDNDPNRPDSFDSGSMKVQYLLSPNETKTFYGQWWIIIDNLTVSGAETFHAIMAANITMFENASKI